MRWSLIALLLLLATRVDCELRVSVRASDGQPVDDAYVAVAAPDRPFSRPTHEAVARRGTLTVDVPPGTYHVLAAARGFQQQIRSVRAGAKTELSFVLMPAVPLTGTVVDSDGKPIEGARVRQLRAVGAAPVAVHTELARKHLEAEWSARTDADGRWTLAGRTDGSVPLLIEADGYAAVHLFRAATDTSAVTLQRGVRLRVNVSRTEPGTYVTLAREGTNEGWERIAWSRAVDAASLTWDSLPPGRYSIFAADADPRTFGPRTPVATVELTADAAIDLTIPPRPKPMRDAVALFIQTERLHDVKAMVSSGGTSAVVPHATERTAGGMLLYLATTAPARQLFVTTADSVITARDSYETIISPRADARVRLTATGVLPRWLTAEFSACTERQLPVLAAAIQTDGTVELPFPTACRVLLLRAEAHAPVIITATVPPRTTEQFGPYALRPAGSARVRVVREPGRKAVGGATVRASLGDTIVAEGVTNERGQLTLRGLPVERELTFAAAARDDGELAGLATARIEIDQTTEIDPLIIPAPAALALAPRVRLPGATIHSVMIEHGATRRSATPEDGEVLFRELRPGTWRPQVLIEFAGNIQPVPLDPIELRGGETRRVDADVEPHVVEGQVLSAGKPFPSQVGFADRPSRDAARRFARTDATGRFTIVLPKRDTYNVNVTPLDRPGGSMDAGEIDCSGGAIVVHVPSAALRVRVLDRGEPVANADIRATLRRASALEPIGLTTRTARSDGRGEAVLDGLLAGRWLVQAVTAGGRAEAAVDLHDDRAAVELRIAPPSALRGIVRHPDNSIEPRARVDCLFTGPGGIPQTAHAETDGEGRFAIDLPTPPPTRLQCGATTAGGRIAAYTLSPTTSADLLLPESTATLRIADWSGRRDEYWLVSGDRLFDLSWSNGVAARLAAGSWKVVRVRDVADWMRLATAGGNALKALEEIRLEEGQAVTIRLRPDGGE